MPTDAEIAAAAIAAARDAERKERRKKLFSEARSHLATATTALAVDDDTLSDEARIAIMGTLRSAINSVHEAG